MGKEGNQIDISIFTDVVFDLKNNKFSGADCIGLTDLFYQCHGWRTELMKYYPKNIKWNLNDFRHIIKYLSQNFLKTKRVEKLEYGDIVIFRINTTWHMGVLVEDMGLLTQGLPTMSFLTTSVIYQPWQWKRWEWVGYKRNISYRCEPRLLDRADKEQIVFNHEPKPMREFIKAKPLGSMGEEDLFLVLSELNKSCAEVEQAYRQVLEIGAIG